MDRVLQNYKFQDVPEFQQAFQERNNNKVEMRFMSQLLNVLED